MPTNATYWPISSNKICSIGNCSDGETCGFAKEYGISLKDD